MKQKQIYIENRLVVATGQGGGGGMNWESGVSRCKLLYIAWASLIAQLVKNPPAMQETPLQFLRWEDPLEKGEASLVAQLVKDPPADS